MTDHRVMTTAEKMLDLLERSVSATRRLVEGVDVDRWDSPSPCEGMSAHGLVEHLVGGLRQFAEVGAGRLSGETGFEASFPTGDAPRQYTQAGARMLAVWSEPGVAERPHAMLWGDTPGSMLLGFMVIEQITHGWDLARATDQEPDYDTDLIEAALELAHEYDDESIRVPGMFGPMVDIAPGASVIDRLAAFLGRDPDEW